MGERVAWTDAEVLADLTRELPLARYCLIGGQVYTWGRLKQPDGHVWLPLGMIIEDNALAHAAPGALCRAGVQAFRSASDAMAWARGVGAAQLSAAQEA